jgi:hypothetical protein
LVWLQRSWNYFGMATEAAEVHLPNLALNHPGDRYLVWQINRVIFGERGFSSLSGNDSQKSFGL